ncbi:ABC transporter substrate-binding protein [Celeribacter ethanolicus]|uniref:ABC transporter substrate-binding protein n=1 Tax=Celeribacter ethanolicus TaxID=1758178 RepID=UPI00082958B1|nr:ABC transporter substrate-binding protein [Celeribacter ethanolicus]
MTVALLSGAAGFAGESATAPARVVSVNLCTDQLAMMLAAPGQLVSITAYSRDPNSSVMVAEAESYPVNHGQAEEIYLLNPDLVVAGQYTARATVSMLRRLGIEVVEFAPARSLDDIEANVLKMGAALGREEEAREIADDFARRLSDISPTQIRPTEERPTAATYAANGYSTGAESLAGEIIDAAGFHTLATELGLPHGGFLPLEALIMADPDLVISGRGQAGYARAEEVLHHPALTQLTGGHMAMQDRDWVCGLPAVIGAVERLREERERLETQ